jgi:hypothetical protein
VIRGADSLGRQQKQSLPHQAAIYRSANRSLKKKINEALWGVSNLVDSGSVIIAAFTLVGGAVGFVVGAFLSDWLAKRREGRENERKVTGLRKLLYEDIVTIYVALNELLIVIEDDLKTPKFDFNNVIVAIKQYQHGHIEWQGTDWYRGARDHPFIFTQLSDSERRAMRQFAGLQRVAVKVSADNCARLREKVEKGEKEPSSLLEALKIDLESIITFMRQAIKAWLDKELLLDVCPDDNKHYILSIFDDERKTAGDEQKKEKKQKQAVMP